MQQQKGKIGKPPNPDILWNGMLLNLAEAIEEVLNEDQIFDSTRFETHFQVAGQYHAMLNQTVPEKTENLARWIVGELGMEDFGELKEWLFNQKQAMITYDQTHNALKLEISEIDLTLDGIAAAEKAETTPLIFRPVGLISIQIVDLDAYRIELAEALESLNLRQMQVKKMKARVIDDLKETKEKVERIKATI